MNKYHIRFNKARGQPGRGTFNHVWRVFENGVEHLVKGLDIQVPTKSEQTGDDWNISCFGFMDIDVHEVAVITNLPPKKLDLMDIKFETVGGLLYAQIDNMYTQQEIEQIQKELIFLETIKQEPKTTNTAHIDGMLLKSGKGMFLDHVYSNREISTILKLNRRLFDRDLALYLKNKSCVFGHIPYSNSDSTLINFYSDGEFYDTHPDAAPITALTFFSIGTFTGGNFCFPEYNVSIEPVPGRTVIFPGPALHRADPIQAAPGNYRVTMAQFVGSM